MPRTKDKKRSKLLGFVYTVLAIVLLFLMLGFGSDSFSSPYNSETVELTNDWEIYYRGRISHHVSLDSFDADGVVTGERVSFEIEMPYLELFSPCITFKTRMSRVRVFDNGHLIYTYGKDIPEGGFVPKATHYIALPKDFARHLVRIEVTAADDSAFSHAYPVLLGDTEDLMRHFVQERRLGIMVGIFMICFGFILCVLSPFLILGTAKDKSVVFSAIIALLLGIYILCYNDVMAYFTHNDVFSHLIEYVSLYLTPIAVIAYVLTGGTVGSRTRMLKIMLALDILFFVSAVALHISGAITMNHLLIPFHVLVFIECMHILVLMVKNDRQTRDMRRSRVGLNSERVLFVGVLLFIGSMVMEMVRYYVLAYVLRSEKQGRMDFMTTGALAVVLSLMLNYFFHSVDHLTEARTRIKLHGMAFTDALTGIDNRASCDQFMAGLDGGEEDYAVVSIDLDGLKMVNDKQGHSIGDMMISGFGALMRDAFSDCDLVGRMGGDEFLVIKKGVRAADMEADIRSLSLGAEEENRRGGAYRYAFSYGTADNTERANVQAVYMLADERMYNMKEEHHRRRGAVSHA